MDPYTYVGDNPETHNDPTGHCWPVCTMLAGAAIGALISGGTSLVSQAISGHGVDWGEVGKQAATGAVAGAISGLAGPEAGLAVHVVADAAAGAASKMVENAFDHKSITDGVVEAAVSNGVMAGAGEAAGPLLKQASGALKEAASGLVNTTTSAVEKDVTSAVETNVASTAEQNATSTAASACGFSFTSNTPVATPTGEKPIADLQVGDQVQSYDVATHKETTQTVQKVFINHDNDLIDVTIRVDTTTKPTTKADINTKQQDAEVKSHGSHAPPTETIHTTEKHPWLTTNGWVTAGELHLGDHALQLDGSIGTIVALQVVPGEQDMYDLTVSNVHTFAVGNGQWVVHNCGGGFKVGISGDEIRSINQNFGGMVEHGSPEAALSAAGMREGFWNKAAVLVRNIAGGHMFDNGNKRTAYTVVQTLMERNNILSGAAEADIRDTIRQVAEQQIREPEDIARRLRGF
jgi:hypothetical protein